MFIKTLRISIVGLMFALAGQAQALILSPGGEYTNEIFYPAYNNPDAADVAAITGSTGVELLYKDNVGGIEEGNAMYLPSYNTEYTDTPLDPSGAIISYVYADLIPNPVMDADWLIVKDGNEAPSWYLFDISAWNGVETIFLTGFWPAQGAISHVSFFSGATPPTTSVPEPSTLALLAFSLLSLGLVRRKAS